MEALTTTDSRSEALEIEAEAQLSTKPGPLKIQNWRRLWPDQVLNLLVVLRESGNE